MEVSFKRNLGNLDRTIRAIVSMALFELLIFRPFPLNGFWPIILGVVGGLLLIEAVLGY